MRQSDQHKDKKKTRKRQIDLTHGPDLSDAALDQLADVTPADVNAAKALWNSKASLPGLLQAKVEEEQK